MKNPQENLATLNIWSRNVTTSTREPTTRAWISADIWRQDGAICSKNRKIVPYHGSARIPRLTVSVPDYGSWWNTAKFHNKRHNYFAKITRKTVLSILLQYDAMQKTISESVGINEAPEGSLMNSENEWNHFLIPRAVVTSTKKGYPELTCMVNTFVLS